MMLTKIIAEFLFTPDLVNNMTDYTFLEFSRRLPWSKQYASKHIAPGTIEALSQRYMQLQPLEVQEDFPGREQLAVHDHDQKVLGGANIYFIRTLGYTFSSCITMVRHEGLWAVITRARTISFPGCFDAASGGSFPIDAVTPYLRRRHALTELLEELYHQVDIVFTHNRLKLIGIREQKDVQCPVNSIWYSNNIRYFYLIELSGHEVSALRLNPHEVESLVWYSSNELRELYTTAKEKCAPGLIAALQYARLPEFEPV